jgi:hypothetical protein
VTSDDPRYHRAPHTLWRHTLDTVVLLPVGSDAEPFALAATGPELWSLLAEPRSVDEMVEVLAVAHGVDPGTVAADVVPLIEQLRELGAIQQV